jgi:hypothetical protein
MKEGGRGWLEFAFNRVIYIPLFYLALYKVVKAVPEINPGFGTF